MNEDEKIWSLTDPEYLKYLADKKKRQEEKIAQDKAKIEAPPKSKRFEID